MIPSYDRGDTVRLGNPTGDDADGNPRPALANMAGVATNPTAVTLRVLTPIGDTLTYNWPTLGAGTGLLTAEAATTGRFYVDVAVTEAGDWMWQLAGSGAVVSSREGTFHVRWSAFA